MFKYFEDFLKIPRKSGNEKMISDYLVNFAIENNLEYYQDEYYNVIIKRKSNNNSKKIIILQGHIDMVCVSNRDFDFDSKGIRWYIEDNMYKAFDTSLGADNGIGCSIILEILSNKELLIPNIEAIFTTNEETNMLGAKKLDYSKITGNCLISIDGTEEGVIEVSSAGMTSILLEDDINRSLSSGYVYEISISGLSGGHSGVDIDKNNLNSIKLMINLLDNIKNYKLISISGGGAYNVIPSECVCIILSDTEIDVHNLIKKYKKYIKINCKGVVKCAKVISDSNFDKLIGFMHNLPIGVLSYNDSYPQTSINLAAIKTGYKHLSIKISIRSSNTLEENYYIDNIKKISNMKFSIEDTIPFFNSDDNDYIRNLLIKEYELLYGKKCLLKHVHAGLEGGVFKENIPNLSICVIAPDIYDIHSTKERVDISSVIRVYNWLINVLRKL